MNTKSFKQVIVVFEKATVSLKKNISFNFTSKDTLSELALTMSLKFKTSRHTSDIMISQVKQIN